MNLDYVAAGIIYITASKNSINLDRGTISARTSLDIKRLTKYIKRSRKDLGERAQIQSKHGSKSEWFNKLHQKYMANIEVFVKKLKMNTHLK